KRRSSPHSKTSEFSSFPELLMSTSTLSAARNWHRDTVPPGSWYERLPDRLLDAFADLLAHPPAVVTDVRLSPTLHDLCRQSLRPAVSENSAVGRRQPCRQRQHRPGGTAVALSTGTDFARTTLSRRSPRRRETG